MPDIVTCGEMLIDFVPTVSGTSLMEVPAFKKAPGGAPANVAVGAARLGANSGFMGKVGDDVFGRFLSQTLRQNDVNVSELKFSSKARTMLAFVSLSEEGDREFMFYRHPSADMLHTKEEINPDYIASSKIFHFGSISLISEPSRGATLEALKIAHENNVLVSYDPNIRLNLWDSPITARDSILRDIAQANIIKISEDEITFLNSMDTLEDMPSLVKSIWHDHLQLLIVTHGRSGCSYYTPDFSGCIQGIKVNTIDTTGAGDAYTAALLVKLLENLDTPKSEEQTKAVCAYANAAGALATTCRGAVPALPTHNQIQILLDKSL